MPKEFTILSPGEIYIDGINIFLDHGDNDAKFRGKRRDDAYYMAKTIAYLNSYAEIDGIAGFGLLDSMNILELGVFAGGSAVFLDKKYQPKKLVCVDYMPESAPALDKYMRENPHRHIAAYYGTDQADKARLHEIIAKEFDGPIHLVIDDASHFYEQSRASFEVTFPYLSQGGAFVLEDWGWAHSAGAEAPDHYWAKQTALTNLVIRLVMAHAVSSAVIRRLGFLTGLMWAQKGPGPLPDNFTLEPYERPRDKDVPLF